MTSLIEQLEGMLNNGDESALLHFSLGNAYAKDDPGTAVTHFSRATELDPQYSAAWKLLGKALVAIGDEPAAIDAYRRGIAVAEHNGDKQAVREMQVFLRRLESTGVHGSGTV